jgi:hypothetical protein
MKNDDERNARQTLRRADALSSVLGGLMAARVEPAGDVLLVTFDEFLNIYKDPKFLPLSQYMRDLVYYADGSLRPKPVRPLYNNEAGVYTDRTGRTRIVCFRGKDPGDTRTGPIIQVTENLKKP